MRTRFPGVKLLSIENGGRWAGPLVKNLELMSENLFELMGMVAPAPAAER